MRILIISIIISMVYIIGSAELVSASDKQDMIDHPEKYIKIHSYGFYVAARVAIIHHVTIENTSDIPYKNIRVKLFYYSTSHKPGQLLSSTSGILPVVIAPNSNGTYLKGGTTLGAGSMAYDARNIRVLGALPILD
jgi:hypothetical protein